MGTGAPNGAKTIVFQVDEETSSEKLMFMDRIKVKHGVIIIRNPSTAADEPKHLVGLGESHILISFLVHIHVTPKPNLVVLNMEFTRRWLLQRVSGGRRTSGSHTGGYTLIFKPFRKSKYQNHW